MTACTACGAITAREEHGTLSYPLCHTCALQARREALEALLMAAGKPTVAPGTAPGTATVMLGNATWRTRDPVAEAIGRALVELARELQRGDR